MKLQPGTTSTLAPDLKMARTYLEALDPGGPFTFQTFPDSKTRGSGGGGLAKVRHGTFDEHCEELVRLNAAGAGIFVMVNAGDDVIHDGGRSVRTAQNVTRVRAVFVDLDGAPLEPVTSCEAPPHIVVESSPGKWHAYWLVADCPLDAFCSMQEALIQRFDGDKMVKDLPRVLRIPGFLHRKAAPCLVRLVRTPAETEHPAPYSMAELRSLLGERAAPADRREEPPSQRQPASVNLLDRVCTDGERTEHLTRIAGSLIRQSLPLPHVVAIARDWNSRNTPPLDESKVEDTCESIYRTHQRNHPGQAERPASAEIIPLFSRAEARIDRYLLQNPSPRRWLLTDCLPQGKVGALIAPGGTGKSQFLLQLATSVATGQPFLGWTIGEPGGVLCLFAEDDDEEIHRRLFNIAAQFGRRPDLDNGFFPQLKANLHIKSMVGLDNLMTIADRHSGEVTATTYADRLLLVAREIPNLKLIVIDPGSRFRGGDENFAQDTTRFVEVLELISRATGANVLVAHHANKGSMNGGEQNQGAQRGSSAFTDGVRWQMNLSYLSDKDLKDFQIHSDEKRLYLTATVVKNNYGAPGIDLVLRRGEEGFLAPADISRANADTDEAALQRVRARIRLEAKAGKTYTRSGFEDTFGGENGPLKIGKNQLREQLKIWVGEGKLNADKKKHLIPDAPMASRYQGSSDKNASETMH